MQTSLTMCIHRFMHLTLCLSDITVNFEERKFFSHFSFKKKDQDWCFFGKRVSKMNLFRKKNTLVETYVVTGLSCDIDT